MLARIPFWGWLLIILAVLYLAYNPLGISAFHMWANGDPTELLPFKILGTLILVAVIGLVVHGTISSMSMVGFVLLVTLVAVTIWSTHALVNFDVLSFDFWAWALQPILAIMLTVGWQWPKIWRRSTGAVSVNDPDTPA
jgi:hypothetical protein